MVNRGIKLLFLSFVLVFTISFVSSTSACWNYTSEAAGCHTGNGCLWKNDSWSSTGWCEELSCWNLNNQTACNDYIVPGKNCTWQTGATTYSCTETSCWSFTGTTANTCENNTANKACTWLSSCFSYSGAIGCWQISDQSSCTNMTGCSWGTCYEKGCWAYSNTSAATCNSGLDYRGNNCTWTSSGSYCGENNCWNTNLYPNQTACNSASGVSCEWKLGSCQEKGCWSFDYTNASTCVNNSIGENCVWSGSFCQEDNCWTAYTNASCSAKQDCQWTGWSSSGWCEELNCWTWDSWNGGNKSQCEGNSYGMSCIWSGNPAGNETSGWCYRDIGSTSCSNITTERDCYDTYYCWWQANDWSDPSAGGNCSDPTWGSGIYANVSSSVSTDWNPGCFIFDQNTSMCNNVIGCNYTASSNKCQELPNTYGTNISNDGLRCSYINDSQLCNNIPALNTCCTWQNGTCSTDYYSTSCVSGLDQTPNGEESCEDADSKSSCDAIAGHPWYMPCGWDNSTEKCDFKVSSVFGNNSQSLVKIDNKRNCEAAGGKWVTENYCEGNVAVPVGRCEYKFDSEENCDKACFACESFDSDKKVVNVTNARSSCVGSKLGFCEFNASASAPNGIGYCRAKKEWKTGVAGDCGSNCGDCTFKGDPSNNDTTKKPSYYCTNSKANSQGGGCKWVSDNSTDTGGYCLDKGDKTCEDACDRCYTQSDCANDGRSALNSTGSCKWQGEANDGSCVSNVAGDVEVCWDGEDNNGDGLVDCADSSCYSDSWCGFVEGDCFGWTDNNSCYSNGCEWVNDTWNAIGWCDFKGSQCWKLDSNESYCGSNTNCQWSNSTGTGWCERDWSIAEVCFSHSNSSTCFGDLSGNCVWTNDTWCQGQGNSSDWCNNYGGWCDHTDFKPLDCWKHYDNSSCAGVSGCNWKLDTWSTSRCEVNWSGGCWDYTDSNTCNNASSTCGWRTYSWGSLCEAKLNQCWSYPDEASCGVAPMDCNWQSYGGGGGMCQPACFNLSASGDSSSCSAIPGCVWKGQPGWCEEQASQACYNTSNFETESACVGTSGCKWKGSGWCDPKDGGFSSGTVNGGGGFGGSSGAECYKYDGNQSYCTNKTIINISCGWFPEPSPFCEVDWGSDCWSYTNTSNGCNSTNGCWWNSDTGYCSNLMDQCWFNSSLYGDADACNTNDYCNASSWGGCEPTCFSTGTEATCKVNTGCKWVSGWCNPSSMNDVFDTMEPGAAVPIGIDICGVGSAENISQMSVDICGFGMKDTGEGFGFGINVFDFSNSSVCNKQKISSNVFKNFGGVGQGSSSERTGDGNESVKFFVYLDSDGSTSGGCKLSNNDSADGYEFRFKYTSEWNTSKSKAAETFNAYKCENSKWVSTDIKLSAWKKLMCSEIGGAMIAVEKTDLTRFPTLYDSTKDMRVYVVTIGETGNVTSPTDTAGPGWTTPGSIDFEITDVFSYGADTAKFEDFMKKGFIEYEDCYDDVDNDNDGNIDCNDWDCQYSSQCTNTGVNAVGHNDTTSPQVTGARIEEYSDSALVIYETNKPANGTLKFYGNDSRCLNLNKSIYDVGITDGNVRQYKLWHVGEVYNSTIGYDLTNNTKYYYKLSLCDSNNKCALSKCSSFVTTSSTKCGFCNFVTRIKAPTGWTVSYDVDQDGTYEHVQGSVCGPNAGMKTNYSAGRSVNVKLSADDGTSYFEFINSSLTKTGLNDKVRTISASGDILKSTDVVGLSSETRDKIINNLHPEACRLKIPNDGNCTTLYHCDDDGGNCVDRTSASTLLDSTSCVWQVPFCEFSTYRTTLGGGSSSSSSGGGGGGGGGSTTTPATNTTTATPEAETTPEGEVGNDSGEGSESSGEGILDKIVPSDIKGSFVWLIGIIGVLVIVGAAFFVGRNLIEKHGNRYNKKVKVVKEKMDPSKILAVRKKSK